MFCVGEAVIKKALVNLNVRMPKALKDLVEKYISADLHTNISEFTRDALREKIQRDAPEFYRQLFLEAHPDIKKVVTKQEEVID